MAELAYGSIWRLPRGHLRPGGARMHLSELEQIAAEALARADPLTALNALAAAGAGGGDGAGPCTRALRGIALAQLQELDGARRELRAAARACTDDPLTRARALAALAEVSAARNELGTALEALAAAADDLAALGDVRNATWARLVRARILLLTGATEEAREDLEHAAAAARADPVLSAAMRLVRANAEVREESPGRAIETLDDALAELSRAEHPLLAGELDAHRVALATPVARARTGEHSADVSLTLPELAAALRGGPSARARFGEAAGTQRWLVVDAIARRLRLDGEDARDLATRDVLFHLLAELALVFPGHARTSELVQRVFGAPEEPRETADAEGRDAPARSELQKSYRDRLRVEVARLRRELPPGIGVEALGNAWRLVVPPATSVVHLALLEERSALTALLADGTPWAARDLALVLGVAPRSVQRALNDLARRGAAEPRGEARARRWTASPDLAAEASQGIASRMLLVSLLAPGRPSADTPFKEA